MACNDSHQLNSETLVMDRLFVCDDHWWIVDFKTSAPASGITTDHFVAEECFATGSIGLQQILEILVGNSPSMTSHNPNCQSKRLCISPR